GLSSSSSTCETSSGCAGWYRDAASERYDIGLRQPGTDQAVAAAMQDVSLPSGLQASPAADAALASAIVRGGGARYIATRRERIEPFVTAHFSLPGTLRLHRAALGWDIARAPLNLVMAAPQAGLWLPAAGGAGG